MMNMDPQCSKILMTCNWFTMYVWVWGNTSFLYALVLHATQISIYMYKCKKLAEQEIIPVRCMPPACKPYMFRCCHQMSVPVGYGSSSEQVWTGLQWWPPDVTGRETRTRGHSMGTRDGVRVGLGIPTFDVNWEVGLRRTGAVRSKASWVMVTWGLPWTDWLTDRHIWKYYLPVTLLAGNN